MRKSVTALAVLALGAMVAVGSATESMARGGGGGGHGGGGHGDGHGSHSGSFGGDGGRGFDGGDHNSGRGGSRGAHAASHSPHTSEHGRRTPNTDDGVLSPLNDPHQQYFFRSLFR
jgi:hypothetical protein